MVNELVVNAPQREGNGGIGKSPQGLEAPVILGFDPESRKTQDGNPTPAHHHLAFA